MQGCSCPIEPVSQYRCMNLPKTDDNDRTHENDANALSWHMVNASFWESASVGPIQVNCFGMGDSMGYSRKKNQRGEGGVEDIPFLKKNPGIVLVFLCVPGNFR